MNFLKKALLGLAFISSLGVATSASALTFQVTGGSFTTGSGFGTGAGQLDVSFTSLVTPQTFNLFTGQTASFLFGRANLRESCINTGIGLADAFLGCSFDANETDNLQVTANLVFASPVSQTVQNVAVTGAIAGPVSGSRDRIFGQDLTDFWIDFSPVRVNLGNGGWFVVDMGDMFFNTNGNITNGYNIELIAVPEPGALAILGLGLLGFAAARRRKQ